MKIILALFLMTSLATAEDKIPTPFNLEQIKLNAIQVSDGEIKKFYHDRHFFSIYKTTILNSRGEEATSYMDSIGGKTKKELVRTIQVTGFELTSKIKGQAFTGTLYPTRYASIYATTPELALAYIKTK